MKSLQSKLSATDLDIVSQNIKLMFDDYKNFITPEALVIYTHSMLSDEELLECCEAEYGFELEMPPIRYVSNEVLDHYKDAECVPFNLDISNMEIHVLVIPEHSTTRIDNFKGYQVVRHKVPLHYYVEIHREFYGEPSFLRELPSKDLYAIIVSEATRLGAADITISTTKGKGGQVYYNVRKKRVDSRISLNAKNVKEISDIIASSDSKTRTEANTDPIYPSVDLDLNHRGRINITDNYYGPYMSIRVLPNKLFDTTPEALNLSPRVIEFLRNEFMNNEKGIRLFVGPPYSGKNTSLLSVIYEKTRYGDFKTISLEAPVELLVDNMEQMNCESAEEFQARANSIIRQNPDIIYITEMTAYSSIPTMEIANTGRELYSSVHANSIADMIPRIADLTNLPLDRIILNLHSAVFQELVRNEEEDAIYPVNTFVKFSTELKDRLLGKSLGEVVRIIREVEAECHQH